MSVTGRLTATEPGDHCCDPPVSLRVFKARVRRDWTLRTETGSPSAAPGCRGQEMGKPRGNCQMWHMDIMS